MIRLASSRPRSIPNEVGAYLLLLSWDRRLTFAEMAALARWRFGPAGPDASEVATHLGAVLHGEPRLKRLDRDLELAEWVVANARAGTLDELLGAIRTTFGEARTPSRSVLGRFLRGLGRRGRMPDAERLAFDVKLLSFLRDKAPGRSLSELGALCEARFGADRAPSKSELHRLLQKEKIGFGRPRGRQVDAEVMTWLRWAARHWPVAEVRKRGLALFGKARMPSRNSLYEMLPQPARGAGAVRRFKVAKDREVLDVARRLAGSMPAGRLHAELVSRFGEARAPSRSALGRLLPHLWIE